MSGGTDNEVYNVFVYGTLMHKRILCTVLSLDTDNHNIVHVEKAQLRGYKRFPIKSQVYPGIKKHDDENAFVEGILLKNITRVQLETLDDFEEVGEEYERHDVKVIVPDSTVEEYDAFVYVMHEKQWNELDVENEWNHLWYEDEDNFKWFHNSAKLFADQNVRRTVTLSNTIPITLEE
jgi:gamma-glutamylcyclotransferase (GGCT)/AIG2-like uncharacterized protein YtfP